MSECNTKSGSDALDYFVLIRKMEERMMFRVSVFMFVVFITISVCLCLVYYIVYFHTQLVHEVLDKVITNLV